MKRALFTSFAYSMFVLMAYSSAQTAEGTTRVQVDAGLNPAVVQTGAAILPILAAKDEVLRSYEAALESLRSEGSVSQGQTGEEAPLAAQSVETVELAAE